MATDHPKHSGGWIQKFETLKDDIEHHVDEEEAEVFDLARRLIDNDSTEKLAEKFEGRKEAEGA